MKKVLMVTATMLVLAVAVMARDEATGLTGKGIKAGLNIAGHHGGDTDEFHKNLTAFGFGGFVTFTFAPHIAVQPELLYMMRGAKWEYRSDTWKGEYNYIEVPVLLKYTIPVEGSVQPNLYAGPSFGILVSANEELSYTSELGTQSGSEDVKDFMKSTDMGLAFGAGVSFAVGSGSVIFDARYTLGLTKIYESDPDLQDQGGGVTDIKEGVPDIKSKMISFMVGYAF